MELYITPTWAKVTKGTELYRNSDEFRRRSRASSEKMLRYWSDPANREAQSVRFGKPVDLFDLEGRQLATYGSSRKAAEAIGAWPSSVRSCCDGRTRSVAGHIARWHSEGNASVPPYSKKPRRKGYRMPRATKRGPWGCWRKKPVKVTFNDGDSVSFESVTECAKALGVHMNTVAYHVKNGKCLKNLYKIETVKNH